MHSAPMTADGQRTQHVRARTDAPCQRQRFQRGHAASLAIAVIGALCISVLLSLVATPVMYYIPAHSPEKISRIIQGKRNEFDVVEMSRLVPDRAPGLWTCQTVALSLPA